MSVRQARKSAPPQSLQALELQRRLQELLVNLQIQASEFGDDGGGLPPIGGIIPGPDGFNPSDFLDDLIGGFIRP